MRNVFFRFLKRNRTAEQRTVASWAESIAINRGQHPESDDIQEVVRHHRKDDVEYDHRGRFETGSGGSFGERVEPGDQRRSGKRAELA